MALEEQLVKQLKLLNGEEKALVAGLLGSLSPERGQFLRDMGSRLMKSSAVNGAWYWRQLPPIAGQLTWEELEVWLGDCVTVSRGNWECALAMLKNSRETMELAGTGLFLQWAQLGRGLMHYSAAEALWFYKNSGKLLDRLGGEDGSLLADWGARMLPCSWQGTVSCLRYWPEIGKILSREEKERVLALGLEIAQAFPQGARDYFQALPGFLKAYGDPGVEAWVQGARRLEKGKKDLSGAYFTATPGLAGQMDLPDLSSRLFQWVAWGNGLEGRSPGLGESFFAASPQLVKHLAWSDLEKIGALAAVIFESCGLESCAEAFLKRAPELLQELDVQELSQWADHGMKKFSREKRQAYFLMKSQESREAIGLFRSGLTLEGVRKVLLLYCEGLTGQQVVIRKASQLPELLRRDHKLFSTLDTRRIYLPEIVKLFAEDQDNLRFYRVLLLHQAAHQDFGTLDLSREEWKELAETPLLGVIFSLLEDSRIDYLAGEKYAGYAKDREELRASLPQTASKEADPVLRCLQDAPWSEDRPFPKTPDQNQGFSGALQQKVADFWKQVKADGSSAGAALALAREIRPVLDKNPVPRPAPQPLLYQGSLCAELIYVSQSIDAEEKGEAPFTVASEFQLELSRLLAHFLEDENNPYRMVAYYDEWDRTLNDYKKDWCRVREILLKPSTGRFVQQTLEENRGMINTLKRYFGMLRPDRFRRFPRQEEGDDIDLDAVLEGMVEQQAGVSPGGGFYIKRDKRERDVAVGFLLDLSYSTEEVVKNTGKTLLDVEQASVVVLAEALEVLGDQYGIYGFNSDGRDQITFYVVKDFGEAYNGEIKQRFGGLKSHGMTRLAAAVRHAVWKMDQVKAAVKILILLSDGRPFDFDYHSGLSKDFEANYTEADTRMALREARMRGVNPFCITVDNRGQEYMDHIFGQVSYIIMDDVAALPTKLTETYKNLTT